MKISIYNFTLFFQILFLVFTLHSRNSSAQVAFKVGANYSTVRQNIPLENVKSVLVSEFGTSVQYFPFKGLKKLSLINEFNFSQKGYRQNLFNEYTFRFDYCSFPVLINYSPFKQISIHSGVELSSLVSTNVRQGLKTYNKLDAGAVMGLSLHPGQTVSFYLRGIYGLVPLLDYYRIDELGNFTADIHDLKNVCVSIGIKINVFNEKFHPYL